MDTRALKLKNGVLNEREAWASGGVDTRSEKDRHKQAL